LNIITAKMFSLSKEK
jgi:homocysteine S-methyltransferase